MTFDSPFWAIEGKVTHEVANSKDKGLVTPEEWEGEKETLLVPVGNWARVTWVKYQSAKNYTIHTLVLSEGDFYKVSYTIMKAAISPLLHYPRLRWSILGKKA